MSSPEIRNLVHFICKLFSIISRVIVKRYILDFQLKQFHFKLGEHVLTKVTWKGPLIWSMSVMDIPTTPASKGILICLSCKEPLLPM